MAERTDASYADVLLALPFMTRAELSMIVDVIGELQPSLVTPTMRARQKAFEPAEFRRERLERLAQALEKIKERSHG